MKKLVIISNGISGIGGGQLHCRRVYLEAKKREYEPYIISACKYSEVTIKELKPFENNIIKELDVLPSVFSKKKQNRVLESIIELFDYQKEDEILIESQGLTYAVWGEMLAQRCGGKNAVYLLGEKFSNDQIKTALPFLMFKYRRNELACITKPIMREMFLPHVDVPEEDCVNLGALSWNEPEDIPIPFAVDKQDGEKCIGVFSRLNKPFVREALRDVGSYCASHKDMKFLVLMIGVGNKKDVIADAGVEQLSNVRIQVTGSVYPIPAKLFDYVDIGISSSGAATIMGRYTPTVSYCAINQKPIGLLGYDTVSTLTADPDSDERFLAGYMDVVFNQKHGDCVADFSKFVTARYNKEERIQKYFSFCEGAKQDNYFSQKEIKITFKTMLKSYARVVRSYIK